MEFIKRLKYLMPLVLVFVGGTVCAEGTEAVEPSKVLFTVSNIWILLCTFLVFIMHLGFATLEIGLTRAKNTVNILFKNFVIVAIGILTYAIIGFAMMYPGDNWLAGTFFGISKLGLGIVPPAGDAAVYGYGDYTYWTDFLFQGMFAATAATIVSGAVAERIKVSSFIIFSAIYVGLVYPLIGSWGWGGGFLAQTWDFHDFAGSTFVHAVGGWGALAGVILLGSRTGKYVNGMIRPIMGHNMPMASVGAFLLWFGWFGFNGGSVLSADPESISKVLVVTTLAAAAGIITSMVASWSIQKKPDLSMVLNGCLAGLVGITAGADCVDMISGIVIGGISGVLVVFSVIFFDKVKLDDPVGALSVHLVCGVFGTLAVGIFSPDFTFMNQLKSVALVAVVSFSAAFAIFYVLKKTMGIRVSLEEEMKGLDIGEHGMEAYSGFQIYTNQ